MTKNNRFKQEVRAYQRAFDVPYMKALDAVSKPFIITPDMESLLEPLQDLMRNRHGVMTLIAGRTNSGKTYLQHYLATEMSKQSYRVIELDSNDELKNWVIPSLEKSRSLGEFSDNLSVLIKSDSSNAKGDDMVGGSLRMAPDLISLPELRDLGQFENTVVGLSSGTNFLGAIHSSGNYYSAIQRYIQLFRPNFLNYFDEKMPADNFIRHTLGMVIDVDRVRVNGKSFVFASHYVMDMDLFQAWSQGNLEEALRSRGFVSAQEKKEKFLQNSE